MSLRRNLGLKLASVAAAFLLWTWIAGQGDVLQTLDVPVDLEKLVPGDLMLVGEPPDKVGVRLRGTELAFRTLSPASVRLNLDLTGHPLQEGLNVIPISTASIEAPAGFMAERVSPAALEFELTDRAVREAGIEPVLVGRPAAGFEVAGTRVTPQQVLVEGPRRALAGLQALSTPAISIEGLDDNDTLRVRPLVPAPLDREVRLVDPQLTVEVRALIRPQSAERIVRGVEVRLAGFPAGAASPRLDPAVADVRVRGPALWVEQLDRGDVIVVLDLSNAVRGSRTLTPDDLETRLADPGVREAEHAELSVSGPRRFRLRWPEGEGESPAR